MKYSELNISSSRGKKRVGRGIAAGQGKTAGRGTKGQNSRAGSSKRPGFEGGQNPLMQRLPKLHGFRSMRAKTQIVTTGQLDKLSTGTIDAHALVEKSLVRDAFGSIKVVSKGELTKKISVKLPGASKMAIEQIEKAGGSFVPTERLKRPVTKKLESTKKK